jgi:hypothetical protein
VVEALGVVLVVGAVFGLIVVIVALWPILP